MYKVLKGFILADGFEGKVDEILPLKDATPKEIKSLLGDGSIQAITSSKPKAKLAKPKAKAKKK